MEAGLAERQGWFAQFQQYANIEKLDRITIVSLIQRIEIGEKKEIYVTFRYADQFAQALAYLNLQNAYYYCASSNAHTGSICERVRLWKAQVEETIASALRVQLCFAEQSEEPVKKKASDSIDCYHELQKIVGELTQLSTKKLERYEAACSFYL